VTSAGRFAFTYGYVEFRARMPAGRGLWPGLWLLPASGGPKPEIDVMEAKGENPQQVHFTYHPPTGHLTKKVVVTGDLSTAMHTFALDWRPGSLTWLLDGQPQFQVTANVPSQPMYLIANLAVGGGFPEPPDASTPSAASFQVDDVQVWRHN
jgi:beta-glucanase (GH16 family)